MYPDRRKTSDIKYTVILKVKVITRGQGYSVGDRIQVRVDLYDGGGRIRSTGGDEVRVWLTSSRTSSRTSSSSQKSRVMAAEVTDLQNGSYVGETTLQWPGVTFVRASLTYPREFLRVLVELRHTLHSMRWVKAVFRDRVGGMKEVQAGLTNIIDKH